MPLCLVQTVIRGSPDASWWFQVACDLEFLLLLAFLFLAVFASWKAFVWLRKWHP
jgi:hypothetical protein